MRTGDDGLKRRLRSIVIPYSALDGDGAEAGAVSQSLETLLGTIGDDGNVIAPGTDPGNAQPPASDTPPAVETAAQQTENKPDKAQQAQFAFAQMRTQNNNLVNLLGKIAKASGIDYTTNAELLEKLNDDTIGKMAQKQNVPVELLKTIETLQADSQAYKQQQLHEAATNGFKQLIDEYKLDENTLMGFAKELDDAGVNPFMTNVDVLAEYKNRHFDDIVNAKIQAAVQAALGRSDVADTHSSTPLDAVGSAGTGTDGTVSSAQELRKLLNTVQ